MTRAAPNLARPVSQLSSPGSICGGMLSAGEREKETYMSCRFRTILALTTAMLVTGALTPVASAWPGHNGAIVFETNIPGGEEEPSRGTGLRIAALGAGRDEIGVLTEDPGDHQPQVSPDGHLVVFARLSNPSEPSRDQPARIFVIRTDGTGLRPLTDGTRNDREPAFSASGKRVYFVGNAGGGTDIFSVALGGGTPRPITSGSADDFHPRASTRGLLTFERRGPTVANRHIYVSRADGSRVRDLTPRLPKTLSAYDPEFSPDGRRIAYSTGDRVISVRTDGARPRLLIPPREASENTYADPTYAPDGRSLLFTIHSGRSSLHRLDLRRLRPLPNPFPEPHLSASAPAWLTEAR
jgi:Tol biopolymer transport system component